jgi:hypothetical protein
VRRGSEAIRIWAPRPPSKSAIAQWREQGSDPNEEPRMAWRLTAVFAQDQVAPGPPPAEPAPHLPASLKQLENAVRRAHRVYAKAERDALEALRAAAEDPDNGARDVEPEDQVAENVDELGG